MKIFALLAILIPLLGFVQSAAADESPQESPHESAVAWNLETTQAPRIWVESVTSGDKSYEIVYLPNGSSIEVPIDLKELGAGSLPQDQVDLLRESARKDLEMVMRGMLSDKFGGDILIDEDGFITSPVALDESGQPLKTQNLLRRLIAFNAGLAVKMTEIDYLAATKNFAKTAWHFIVVETYQAGIQYVRRFKKAAPGFREYGASFNFKIEPQIFIGRFNPTQRSKWTRKSYAFAFEISFNRETKKVAIHTRLRREKGSGGFGLPAVKAEFKFFETDGTHRAQGGESWYPVSPPLISFVLDRDHANHYFAQGITLGFNTGDLVPGSTLTNTFTQYQQVEDPIHFENVPGAIRDALNKAAHAVIPHGPSQNQMMCSSIFG